MPPISVRRFIASVLVIAYRTMAVDALAAALNFAAAGSAEFTAWVAAENASGNAWAVDAAAGAVRLPSVDENQVRFSTQIIRACMNSLHINGSHSLLVSAQMSNGILGSLGRVQHNLLFSIYVASRNVQSNSVTLGSFYNYNSCFLLFYSPSDCCLHLHHILRDAQARSQRAALEIISLQRVSTLNASVFASS